MKPAVGFKFVLFFTVLLAFSPFAAIASDYEVGLIQYSQGDYDQALKSLHAAADNDEPGAASLLARMYRQGLGTDASMQTAFQWSLVAAKQGAVEDQFQVAEYYAAAANQPYHSQNAVYWYQAAANQGHHEAHYRLAKAYELGRGVDVDHAMAKKLLAYATSRYQVFAEKGDARSQNTLAKMYEVGDGVAQDYTLALNWYQKAAYAGLAEAQYHFGRLLSSEEAGEPKLAQAAFWLKKAAENGVYEAQMLLAQVEASRSSEVALK